jgi:glyoxylase-like metal-dependent hydrolase (beta-lactamase superfamily II)
MSGKRIKNVIRWAVIIFAALLFLAVMGFRGWRKRTFQDFRIPETVQVDDSTYFFQDVTALMHLLVGKDSALVIDTGFGLANLKEAVNRLTDKPVKVINTHGHFDHTHGNWQFGGAMVSYKDLETISRHDDAAYLYDNFLGNPFMKLLIGKKAVARVCNQPKADYRPLPESMTLDLGGGRIIRLYEIPGHTPGSIALLDVKYHRLYTGDMFCSGGVLLQLPESTDVETYLQSVRYTRQICQENGVQEIFPSHPECPLAVSVLDDFEAAALRYLHNERSEKEIENKTSAYGSAIINVKQ